MPILIYLSVGWSIFRNERSREDGEKWPVVIYINHIHNDVRPINEGKCKRVAHLKQCMHRFIMDPMERGIRKKERVKD